MVIQLFFYVILTPASYNPVDALVLKLHENQTNIYSPSAHKVVNDGYLSLRKPFFLNTSPFETISTHNHVIFFTFVDSL